MASWVLQRRKLWKLISRNKKRQCKGILFFVYEGNHLTGFHCNCKHLCQHPWRLIKKNLPQGSIRQGLLTSMNIPHLPIDVTYTGCTMDFCCEWMHPHYQGTETTLSPVNIQYATLCCNHRVIVRQYVHIAVCVWHVTDKTKPILFLIHITHIFSLLRIKYSFVECHLHQSKDSSMLRTKQNSTSVNR